MAILEFVRVYRHPFSGRKFVGVVIRLAVIGIGCLLPSYTIYIRRMALLVVKV